MCFEFLHQVTQARVKITSSAESEHRLREIALATKLLELNYSVPLIERGLTVSRTGGKSQKPNHKATFEVDFIYLSIRHAVHDFIPSNLGTKCL
jgi:hypothetical protein